MLGKLEKTTSHRAPVRRTPAPVVTALEDAALVEEVGLVTAVTGRDLLAWSSETELPAGTVRVILVTESGPDGGPGTCGRQVAAELLARSVACRTVTVSTDPTAPEPAVVLPSGATVLATRLGAADHPDFTVLGAVGGAGASTFAAALAGALAEPSLGGEGRALLVETSGHRDLDRILGLENIAGHRLPDLAGTPALTTGHLGSLPWAGDVAVLAGAGGGSTGGVSSSGAVPDLTDTCCPVVRDAGRWCRAAAGTGTATTVTPAGVSGCPVLVVPATVPGTMAGRDALAHLPGAAVVLREVPRAELEWNDALTLLGRAPEVTWPDDPFLTGETDRGDFTPTGPGAGTAGTAAARLVTALAGRL